MMSAARTAGHPRVDGVYLRPAMARSWRPARPTCWPAPCNPGRSRSSRSNSSRRRPHGSSGNDRSLGYKVKHDVAHRHPLDQLRPGCRDVHAVLQQAKIRPPVCVERDELAVNGFDMIASVQPSR